MPGKSARGRAREWEEYFRRIEKTWDQERTGTFKEVKITEIGWTVKYTRVCDWQ